MKKPYEVHSLTKHLILFLLLGWGSACKVDTPTPEGMVPIPAGTFIMGSPSTEVDRKSDEGPQTGVTITKGFWMGKYEVTQKEYQAVMGSNPSHRTGDLTCL